MIAWWWIPVSWILLLGFTFAGAGFTVVFLGFRQNLKARKEALQASQTGDNSPMGELKVFRGPGQDPREVQ